MCQDKGRQSSLLLLLLLFFILIQRYFFIAYFSDGEEGGERERGEKEIKQETYERSITQLPSHTHPNQLNPQPGCVT